MKRGCWYRNTEKRRKLLLRFKDRPSKRREKLVVAVAKLREPAGLQVLTVGLNATTVDMGVVPMDFERMMKRSGIAGVDMKDDRQAVFVS